MAQMFCTLKQAAHKLETTEAEIETLIRDGILREFRDGSDRLLKVADLAGAAVTAGATADRQPARMRRKARSPQPELEDEPESLEIKLPSAAAASVKVSPPRGVTGKRSSRPVRHPPGRTRDPYPVVQKPAISQRRQNPPRAVVVCPPTPPQEAVPYRYEMSLRQWLWTGLLDDNPIAIFIIFGTTLLAAGGLAGAAYLLLQVL